MNSILGDISGMMSVVVIAMLIVLMAMVVDLISGLRKAKRRGDLRTSTGLKRTLSKFISYEGGMLIASGVDILIHLCKLYQLFHLDVICGVPVITCGVGVFLCIVEFISVREKAEAKTKKEFSNVEMLALQALTKRENREILLELLDRIQGRKSDCGAGHVGDDEI